MTNVSIYVSTYNLYNEGSLFGKWFELSGYSDLSEFYKDIRELHRDEDDPEFMFQDYEASGLIISLGLISECHISDNIFEILETIENSVYGEKVIEAYIDFMGYNDEEIKDVIEKVANGLMERFKQNRLVIEFTDETLMLEASEKLDPRIFRK